MANFNYVSCIKIRGEPILPPLLSEEDRRNIALYKEKAIQKENEIKTKKGELFCISTLSDDVDLNHSDSSLETANVMEFIRQALSDVGQSDIKLLQKEILEEMQNINAPLRSFSCDTLNLLEDISLNDDKVLSEQGSLNHSIDAPTEHSINEEMSLKLDYRSQEQATNSDSSPSFDIEDVTFNRNMEEKCQGITKANSEDTSKTNVKTPPKLIRRNSYTLESPSPSVLLYLKSLPKSHSDNSSLETASQNKVVKNLNNFWTYGENVSTPKAFTNFELPLTVKNHCLSDDNCDNINTPRNIGDQNSNVLKNKHEGEDFSVIKKGPVEDFSQSINVTPEMEKAVIVIQAGIRGYLIRRLMKTNKVMELRDTIKDSLVCALALHSEENIGPSDVDLHVRLYRQVTAACFELHAIFFEYTPRDKMNLISLDREKVLSAERTIMNLKRLKGVRSDDECLRNGIKTPTTGKPRRPSSLPMTRAKSVTRPWR